MEPGEVARAYLAVREFDPKRFVFSITRKGRVKRTTLGAFANPRRKGIVAMGVGDGDELVATVLTAGSDDILLVTRLGQAIRFQETDVRDMGRTAAGVRGITLGKGDVVIDGVACRPEHSLLIVSDKGLGKRTSLDDFPRRHRGGKGVIAAKLVDRSGQLAAAMAVAENSEVILSTRGGTVIRIKAAEVRRQGRASTGVRLMDVRGDDVVTDVARVED